MDGNKTIVPTIQICLFFRPWSLQDNLRARSRLSYPGSSMSEFSTEIP